MRILVVPSWYPTPEHPYSGIFVRQQASALATSNQVRVLYMHVLPRGHSPTRARKIRQRGSVIEETIEVRNVVGLWQFVYLMQTARSLRRLKKTFQPDVVHAHVAVPAGWATGLLRQWLGLPTVLTEHTSEFQSWSMRPGARWMASQAYSRCSALITVSEGQRANLLSAFPGSKRPIVVSNGVDTRVFAPAPMPAIKKHYNLLFVGLLDTDQKGLGLLLEALALIRNNNQVEIQLNVVGDGLLRAVYEARAQALGLADRVSFLGLMPQREIADLLLESHALVQPSLHESQGVVIIEALASGRPVISTRCGGPEYMVNESNGIIVEPGQAEPLADAMVELLTHLERYNPFQIAREAAEKYSYEAVTAALTRVYEKVLSRKT